MGKGGGGKGGYKKTNHTRGSKFGSIEDFEERNGEPLEKEDGGKAVEESSEEEEAAQAKQKKQPLLAQDADLDAELARQFDDPGGLTRKQREELEKQQQERDDAKAKKDGNTDEARADMERLAEIRKKREEAAKKKEQDLADAAKKVEAKAEKDAGLEAQRGVAVQVAKLVRESKDGKMTLNMLNQDAACKKVLKPLCKKEGVKAINKAWLSQFKDLLELKDEGKELMIYPKGE